MLVRFIFGVVIAMLLFAPVEGCMKGGISTKATYSLIAICVIFSPVIAAGYAGYIGYNVTKKGVKEVKENIEAVASNMRTSNIIRKQRNRVVKKVGAKNFDNYIQQLFDRCKLEPTPDNFLELGTALFLNNDLSGAISWLTDAIEVAKPLGRSWEKLGSALFVRGVVHQYLYDFDGAISDFDAAQKELTATGAEGGATTPQLNLSDAINASGYAKMQKALYNPTEISVEESESLLTVALTEITAAINTSPDIQGMYHHNRGYTRYHRSFLKAEAEREGELLLAIADFDAAIESGNFGTTAEGHAMKAQALALIGKYEQATEVAKKARELDHKVFIVDLKDRQQLGTPWPLPREKFRNQENVHSFTETKFHRPHYCDHCSELIKVGQGYMCYVCDFRVHTRCHPRVKGKDCWAAIKTGYATTIEEANQVSKQNKEIEKKSEHVHHLKATHFHKPTWCNLCLKIVASPIGKQGFQCVDCGVKLHKNCLDLAGNHFIED